MPVKWDGKLPEDICLGNEQVQDIYIGDKHVWGWHTLTLISEGADDEEIRFLWGVGVPSIPTPTMSDDIKQKIKDYVVKWSNGKPEDSKISVIFKGWTDDPECYGVTQFITEIPATKDEDVNLYAVWDIEIEATKYTYEWTEIKYRREWVVDDF